MTPRTLAGIVLILILTVAAYYAGRAHRPAAAAPVAPAAADAAPAAPAADSVTADREFDPAFVKTALPVQQTVDDTLAVTGKLSLDKQQVRLASSRVAGR